MTHPKDMRVLREKMLDRLDRVDRDNAQREPHVADCLCPACATARQPVTDAPQKAMLYRVTVWAKVPITEGIPDMTAREVEKQTFKLLKAADFDADCEVMDSEEIED